MELTDGWYSIKTIIDKPLCTQVYKKNIIVGTKLIIQGAELENDEPCDPLRVIIFSISSRNDLIKNIFVII